MRRSRWTVMYLALPLPVLAGVPCQAAAAAADSLALVSECEYGISLALAGKTQVAESVFVSLLSHSPRDPRALNNLGNLHLLRGASEVALIFYDQAQVADPTDPGIGLARSTALMLQGDEATARREAERAVQMAGGVEQAAALLGLRLETAPASKAAEQTILSKEEVRELLLNATSALVVDTTLVAAPVAGSAAPATSKPAAPAKRGTARRSAGPRSAERSDAAMVLYWKR